jgi:hypothetical protein
MMIMWPPFPLRNAPAILRYVNAAAAAKSMLFDISSTRGEAR